MQETSKTIVSESGAGKYTLDILSGGHSLTADEPVVLGGDNKGPDPYGLLVSALGSCTVMTIRMYADMKKIPLTNTFVTLSHQKKYVEDCETCVDGKGKIDIIERNIRFEGELSDDEKNKLLKIADKCPVHRTLTTSVRIKTLLKD